MPAEAVPKLLSVLFRHGAVDDALAVYVSLALGGNRNADLGRPTVQLCNQVIAGCMAHGRLADAEGVFGSMKRELGLVPDARTYEHMMRGMAGLFGADLDAEQRVPSDALERICVLASGAEEAGVQLTDRALVAVMAACFASANKPVEDAALGAAPGWLSAVIRENEDACTRALAAAMYTRTMGHSLNKAWPVLVKGCLERKNLAAATAVLEMCVSLASDAGQVRSWWHLFGDVLRARCHAQQLRDALDLYAGLGVDAGLSEHADVVYELVKHLVYAKRGDLALVVYHDAMAKGEATNWRKEPPLLGTFNSVLAALSSGAVVPAQSLAELLATAPDGELPAPEQREDATLPKFMRSDVWKVLGDMADRGVAPDAVTYKLVVRVLLREGFVDRALGVFDAMRMAGVQAKATTYNQLLHHLLKSGRGEEAEALLADMHVRGPPPDMYTMNELVGTFVRAGRIESAESLVADLRKVGVDPDEVTYTQLLSGWGLNARPRVRGYGLLRAFEIFDTLVAGPGLRVGATPCGALLAACLYQPRYRADEGADAAAFEVPDDRADLARLCSEIANDPSRRLDLAERTALALKLAGMRPNSKALSWLASAQRGRTEHEHGSELDGVLGRLCPSLARFDRNAADIAEIRATVAAWGGSRPRQASEGGARAEGAEAARPPASAVAPPVDDDAPGEVVEGRAGASVEKAHEWAGGLDVGAAAGDANEVDEVDELSAVLAAEMMGVGVHGTPDDTFDVTRDLFEQ